MKKLFFRYWIFSWIFAVLFGEIITGLISQNPMFFENALPITLYYGVLCFIFAFLVTRFQTRSALIIFFVYGVLVELYLFHNIKGWGDLVGIIFFGLLYIFLFGLPLYLIKRRLARQVAH